MRTYIIISCLLLSNVTFGASYFEKRLYKEELFNALYSHNDKKFKGLLSRHPSLVNARSKLLGYTPLLELCVLSNHPPGFAQRHIPFVLSMEAEVNVTEHHEGWSPLLWLTYYETVPYDIVALILKHGADANIKIEGFIPLRFAAENGREDLVKLLLQNGADKTMKSNSGKTAVDYAKEEGHEKIAELITKWPTNAT